MVRRQDMFLAASLLAVCCIMGIAVLFALSGALSSDLRVAEDSVGIIDIGNEIVSPDGVVESLDRMIESDRIPAIVIRIDSPGGGVAATQEIHAAVRRARDEGKIVIASMGSVAASGGYYIAAACDTIMATPGTLTGSIGVIATFPDLSGLYGKIGVGYTVIKSGSFKDTGSSSRTMTGEEKAYLETVVQDIHDQFVEAVVEGRGLDSTYVRGLADGRVFSGRQALANGLIDTLGTFQDAIDLAGERAGLGIDPPVYRESSANWLTLLTGELQGMAPGLFRQQVPGIQFLMHF